MTDASQIPNLLSIYEQDGKEYTETYIQCYSFPCHTDALWKSVCVRKSKKKEGRLGARRCVAYALESMETRPLFCPSFKSTTALITFIRDICFPFQFP